MVSRPRATRFRRLGELWVMTTHEQTISNVLPEAGKEHGPRVDGGKRDAWYVARSQPQKERYAAAALEQRGVESYLPVLTKAHARAGRRNWEPFFAGYLFAKLR